MSGKHYGFRFSSVCRFWGELFSGGQSAVDVCLLRLGRGSSQKQNPGQRAEEREGYDLTLFTGTA